MVILSAAHKMRFTKRKELKMKYQFANGVAFDTEAELKAYLLGLENGLSGYTTDTTEAETKAHVEDIKTVLAAQGWTGWPVTAGSEIEGDKTEAEKAEDAPVEPTASAEGEQQAA